MVQEQDIDLREAFVEVIQLFMLQCINVLIDEIFTAQIGYFFSLPRAMNIIPDSMEDMSFTTT